MTSAITIANPKSQIENSSTIASQLSAQYQKAVGGLIEQIKFGAMLMMLERTLSSPGRDNGGKFDRSGDGVKGWLETNCPDINRATAYRFMDCARVVKQELQIGDRTDMAMLLGSAAEALNPKQQRVRASIEKFITGKSQRQLLLDFRAGVPDPKPRGGAREHAPDTRSDEEKRMEHLQGVRKMQDDTERTLKIRYLDGDDWRDLHKNELLAFQGLLESVIKEISAHLRNK